MVREIIHIQVGQCGNQIGLEFWDKINKEHLLDTNGKFPSNVDGDEQKSRLDKIEVYYQEAGTMRFRPRACLVDLEPNTMDIIGNSQIGTLFKPDNMIFGSSGSGNNYAKGHYTEGAELLDHALDAIRKEVEKCDCPQGFQLAHGLGGGTGSGMGTLILLKITDTYGDRISATFSVYPSPKVSDTVVEPYNAVLSTHQLLENSMETFVIDNEALYRIAADVLKQAKPNYAVLNWITATAMSGITSSLRFNGKLNGDLRKMGTNLVPFPRLHFCVASQAALLTKTQVDPGNKITLGIQELTKQMWSSKYFLAGINPAEGKYLSAMLEYRGDTNPEEIDAAVAEIQEKNAEDFAEYVPNNMKTDIVSVPPEGTADSGTLIANTTALKDVFQRLSDQFGALYKRKAFLHWYKGEGMDEMEFQEADKSVRDLITEYQDKQDVVVDLEEDDEDPEEESF